MYASTRTGDVSYAQLFRSAGRVSAVILFASWLVLFAVEFAQHKIVNPPIDTFYQAAALAVIFVGYAVGWRHELAGGWLAIVGTAAFIIIAWLTAASPSGLFAAVWFAAPGVLFLLARHFDRLRANRFGRLS